MRQGKDRKSSSPPVLLAGLLLFATLVAGIIAGAALDRVILVRQHRLLPREGLRFVSSRIVKRLDRELALSPEQERAVTAILERHRQAVENSWKEVQPRMHQEIDKANGEIEGVLGPEQKARFAELRKRWKGGVRHFSDGD